MRGLFTCSSTLFLIFFSHFVAAIEPPHFDLEMSSYEYRKALPAFTSSSILPLNPVNASIQAGERLFKWIDLINEKRSEDNKIRLTSKATRKGIPITSPSKYSPKLIKTRLNNLKSSLPKKMTDIIFHKKAPVADTLVGDKEFITFARQIDRLYQTASRWKLLQPYKSIYSQRRSKDIRGFYYLQKNKWDENFFNETWDSLSSTEKAPIKEALVGICINSTGNEVRCQRKLNSVDSTEHIVQFYKRYIRKAEKVWNGFFKIRNARSDIRWKASDDLVATMPFLDPMDDLVRAFVKENVEDEFQWNDWWLQLNFTNKSPSAFIRFVAGATPNVNRLGGNRITMDANRPIDEYEVQWTIRHEFGHVLGLPDCYHEFFDKENNQFINYQIDTTDLMCSRAGNMNERIYLELKEKYLN